MIGDDVEQETLSSVWLVLLGQTKTSTNNLSCDSVDSRSSSRLDPVIILVKEYRHKQKGVEWWESEGKRKEALDLAAVFSELRPGRNLYQKKFSNSDNKFETSSSIISNKIFRNSAISYLELV